MLYQIPLLMLMFWAVSSPDSEAGMILATVMIVFSSMFYWLVFNAMTGQKEVAIDLDVELHHLWQNRTVSIAGAIVLYKLGMIGAFYYVLPFQMVAFMCDLLATGFKIGWLGLEEVEREDED